MIKISFLARLFIFANVNFSHSFTKFYFSSNSISLFFIILFSSILQWASGSDWFESNMPDLVRCVCNVFLWYSIKELKLIRLLNRSLKFHSVEFKSRLWICKEHKTVRKIKKIEQLNSWATAYNDLSLIIQGYFANETLSRVVHKTIFRCWKILFIQ